MVIFFFLNSAVLHGFAALYPRLLINSAFELMSSLNSRSSVDRIYLIYNYFVTI